MDKICGTQKKRNRTRQQRQLSDYPKIKKQTLLYIWKNDPEYKDLTWKSFRRRLYTKLVMSVSDLPLLNVLRIQGEVSILYKALIKEFRDDCELLVARYIQKGVIYGKEYRFSETELEDD